MKRFKVSKVVAFTLTLITIMFATLIQSSAAPRSGAGVSFFEPEPTIYKVTFYSNDERVDTTLGEVEVAEGNRIESKNMPVNPTRTGHRFNGWSTRMDARGTAVTGSTVITSDLDVYAQWDEIPPPPTPEPTPEPTPQPTPEPSPPPQEEEPVQPPVQPPAPPVPTPTPIPVQVPEDEPEEEGEGQEPEEQVAGVLVQQDPPPPADPPPGDPPSPLQEHDSLATDDPAAQNSLRNIEDTELPRVSFGNRSLVLFAPLGFNSWALLNLILSILGILFVAMTILRTLTQRKKDREEEEEKEANSNDHLRDEEAGNKRHRLTWLAFAAVAALAGILLFFLTQDMRAPMVLTDWWTLIHVIFFIAIFIACPLVFKKKEDEEDSPDSEEQRLIASHPILTEEEEFAELRGLNQTT